MTKKVFETMLASLCTYYGKTLDAMAMHTYLQEVSYIQDGDTRELYRKILQNCKYFPALTEFREIVGMIEKKPVPLRNVERCWYCMDRGTIPYTKQGMEPFKSYPYEFHARCPMCNNGKQYSGWPSFLAFFDRQALEEVKQKNLETFGDLTVSQIEAAKIAAKNFTLAFGGGR